MQGFTQAKKKFGQITWLILGLCFVLLYSCPVKKFLIIYFDKAQPAKNTSAQFRKAHSTQYVKIVYLHKDPSAYTVLSPARSLRPVIPSPQSLLAAADALTGMDPLSAAGSLQLHRQWAFAADPPRYLQWRRLLL